MLRYVTTNPGKAREAREHLAGVVEGVERAEYDYAEVQSDDLTEIAARGARESFEALGDPVVVDDAGLFVRALDGFPGPYSSYVEETLGIERVQRLVEPEDDDAAAFRCAVGYADADVVRTFVGAVEGEIVPPRGDEGFGYDPVFEHDGRTFAEMTTAEKNALSHRGRALDALADWLAERGGPRL